MTWTRSARRASRWPIASETAPPTPVSISSKTSVGAEPRSASTTFSASMKRDSSPPDATFISGPGRVPGLVCTQNSTRSKPAGVAARLVGLDLRDEARALELERRQLRLRRPRRAPARPPVGPCDRTLAAARDRRVVCRGSPRSRARQLLLARHRSPRDRREALPQGRQDRRPATSYLRAAARSANSRSSVRSSSRGSNSVARIAVSMAPARLVDGAARTASSAATLGSTSVGSLRARGARACAARPHSAGTGEADAGHGLEAPR